MVMFYKIIYISEELFEKLTDGSRVSLGNRWLLEFDHSLILSYPMSSFLSLLFFLSFSFFLFFSLFFLFPPFSFFNSGTGYFNLTPRIGNALLRSKVRSLLLSHLFPRAIYMCRHFLNMSTFSLGPGKQHRGDSLAACQRLFRRPRRDEVCKTAQ